ncbi:hypothetical protein J6590_105833 [Homalodisca vitripennis]|nr:hypothetical protein J6590_105833 [Homalodisca vitripennis]
MWLTKVTLRHPAGGPGGQRNPAMCFEKQKPYDREKIGVFVVHPAQRLVVEREENQHLCGENANRVCIPSVFFSLLLLFWVFLLMLPQLKKRLQCIVDSFVLRHICIFL